RRRSVARSKPSKGKKRACRDPFVVAETRSLRSPFHPLSRQLVNRLGVDGRRLEEILHLDVLVRLVGGLFLARKQGAEGDAVLEGPGIGTASDGQQRGLVSRPLLVYPGQGADQRMIRLDVVGRLVVRLPDLEAVGAHPLRDGA